MKVREMTYIIITHIIIYIFIFLFIYVPFAVTERDYAYYSWRVIIPQKTINIIILALLIITCPLASIAYELDRRKAKNKQSDSSTKTADK